MKVKKLSIIGKNKEYIKDIAKELKSHGIKIDNKKPDIVISLGGDGTYLYSERLYPNIPKLLIRDSNICYHCNIDRVDQAIEKLKTGNFKIKEHMKLEMKHKNVVKTASNDVVIRNKDLFHAMRYQVFINNEPFNGEFIGDGIVISTPFGSTAYFNSITKHSFNKGIGLGFNNIKKKCNRFIAKDDSEIKIRVTRTKALMSCDNDKEIIELDEGDEVIIKKSTDKAKIIDLKMGFIERLKHKLLYKHISKREWY